MFDYLVYLLQNRKIIDYIENHSVIYNTFTTAAEKITHPKYLLILASIFYYTDLPDEQASALLHSQQIA